MLSCDHDVSYFACFLSSVLKKGECREKLCSEASVRTAHTCCSCSDAGPVAISVPGLVRNMF